VHMKAGADRLVWSDPVVLLPPRTWRLAYLGEHTPAWCWAAVRERGDDGAGAERLSLLAERLRSSSSLSACECAHAA
jgi:hypothetical protein